LRLIGPRGTSRAQHFKTLRNDNSINYLADFGFNSLRFHVWSQQNQTTTTKQAPAMQLDIDPELMDDHIKCTVFRIDQELHQIEKRRRELSAARLSLQVICRHQFTPDGHTHGGNYEACIVCGFTQKQ